MAMIQNEAAYERARAARIHQNASITRRRKWLAENADAGRIEQFLIGSGEFDFQCAHCKRAWGEHLIQRDEYAFDAPTDKCRQIQHPVRASATFGKGFEIITQLRDAMHQWGGLTPKQADLVRNMIARSEARVAERAAAREQKLTADREGSQHVGTVGERVTLTLTVERILGFESQFGMTFINLCRDASGSVVVYKGSNRLVENDDELPAQVTVKATIKAHDVRDGVAQTLIARPKAVTP